ncbi:MAG TPA: catalase-related domain-containing protein, partial [Kofleriaceae bacterium]|nr:catalase-related domain-containing protein [Kofleriaceae bacterium]
SFPEPLTGTKIRQRSETFADHHSQARMFYRSQTAVEQRHIVNAYTFELSKVASKAVRTRQLGHLELIDKQLAAQVADNLGMAGQADAITPARQPIDMEPSPALSILKKAPQTLEGRKVGILIGAGCDAALIDKLRAAITKAGAKVELVAPKVGETEAANGTRLAADHMVAGGPSVIFDACAIVVGDAGIAALVANPAAVQWVADAFNHCKVIGTVGAAQPLLDKAAVVKDKGVIDLAGKGADAFVTTAKQGRIWSREAAQTPPPAKKPAKKPSK